MASFQVENMSCGACARRITDAINAVAPGAQVQIDMAAKRVRVDADVSAAAVREAIRAAGYAAVE